ncbi:hypothetical protein [Azotobacter chroococcum]|nr:hypothetical protein [Azotobacter chroococcum]
MAHAPWQGGADGFYRYERTETLMGQGLPNDLGKFWRRFCDPYQLLKINS